MLRFLRNVGLVCARLCNVRGNVCRLHEWLLHADVHQLQSDLRQLQLSIGREWWQRHLLAVVYQHERVLHRLSGHARVLSRLHERCELHHRLCGQCGRMRCRLHDRQCVHASLRRREWDLSIHELLRDRAHVPERHQGLQPTLPVTAEACSRRLAGLVDRCSRARSVAGSTSGEEVTLRVVSCFGCPC